MEELGQDSADGTETGPCPPGILPRGLTPTESTRKRDFQMQRAGQGAKRIKEAFLEEGI